MEVLLRDQLITDGTGALFWDMFAHRRWYKMRPINEFMVLWFVRPGFSVADCLGTKTSLFRPSVSCKTHETRNPIKNSAAEPCQCNH